MIRFSDRSNSSPRHYLYRNTHPDSRGEKVGYKIANPRADQIDRRKIYKGNAKRKLEKPKYTYKMSSKWKPNLKPLGPEINDKIAEMNKRYQDELQQFLDSDNSNSRDRSRSRSRSRSRTPLEESVDRESVESEANSKSGVKKQPVRRFRKNKKRLRFELDENTGKLIQLKDSEDEIKSESDSSSESDCDIKLTDKEKRRLKDKVKLKLKQKTQKTKKLEK